MTHHRMNFKHYKQFSKFNKLQHPPTLDRFIFHSMLIHSFTFRCFFQNFPKVETDTQSKSQNFYSARKAVNQHLVPLNHRHLIKTMLFSFYWFSQIFLPGLQRCQYVSQYKASTPNIPNSWNKASSCISTHASSHKSSSELLPICSTTNNNLFSKNKKDFKCIQN